jgi:hypothetical protein
MKLGNRWIVIVLGTILVPDVTQAQINQGQVDTFETGTTLSWTIGAGFAGPTVQPGGPNGINDHYLQLVTGQAGGPPRFTLFNQVQWSGNYNSPNPPGSLPVNAIELDIANFSATLIAARIAVKVGGGQSAGYVFNGAGTSTGAFEVPGDGQWRHFVFPINTQTMVAVTDPFGTPPPPLSQLLNNVFEMRLLHSVSPALMGDPLVGRAGVDNIQATFLVPEPGGVLGVATAAMAMTALVRRRRAVCIRAAA